MTWTTVEPVAAPVKGQKPAVTIGLVARLGRNENPRLLVTVRAGQVGRALAWWKKEAGVQVQIGSGEHVGKLRLSSGGEHKLIGWGGGKSNKVTSPVLRIPLPPGVATVARKGVLATYEVHGTDLIVHLPDWAMPPVSATAKQPFRSAATAPDFARARG